MAQRQSSGTVADAPDTLPEDFFDKKKETTGAAPDTLPGNFFDEQQSQEESPSGEPAPHVSPEHELPSATPRLKAAAKTFQAPTKFEAEREPDQQEGVLSHGLGVIGNQIGSWAKSTVAPYTKGYETYEAARQKGMGMLPSLGAGVARGLISAAPGGDTLEDIQSGLNIPKEYKERRQAGYGPVYSALAPQAAPVVGVDLPSMEHQADIGNVRGVIAEGAVPAGEALAGYAAHSPQAEAAGKYLQKKFGTAEAPNVAAQRALRPQEQFKNRTLENVAKAGPFLEGAKDLKGLQAKIPQAKTEVWQPYKDTLARVGNNEVAAPDMIAGENGLEPRDPNQHAISLNDLEKERLKVSALQQNVRKMRPVDQQGILQKQGTEAALKAHYDDILSRLDPELEAAGIDPKKIRETHGAIKGIEKLVAGKNTLTDADKAYGLGKLFEIDIRKPFSNLPLIKEAAGDIVAGRPLFKGKARDVAVKEGFGDRGPKPDFTRPVVPTQPTPIHGALPAPATPMPGPVDLGGTVRGGRWTTPAGALPAPAPIAPQFVREIPPMRPPQPAPPTQLPEAAASRVPPETNIPPMTEPEFAREEVQPGTTELAPERQLGAVGRGGIRTTPAAELPKIARSHVIQDKIDRLKLEEADLRRAGNSGAANAKKVARQKLEAQVPAGFEETPAPKVAGETTLGKIGRKVGGEAKRLAKEEEGSLNLGRIGDLVKKKEVAPGEAKFTSEEHPEAVADEPDTILKMHVGGKEVGHIGYFDDPNHPEKTLTVVSSKINPEFRNQGLGQRMYQELFDRARQQGYDRVSSDASLSEDAARLWKSFVKKGIAEEGKPMRGMYSVDLKAEEEVPYTRPMPIPESKTGGGAVPAESIHHHELAHVIVAGMDGFVSSGIASHRIYGRNQIGPSASALFPADQFRTSTGGFKPEILTERANDFTDLLAAGAAVNELIDNMPRDKNQGLYGDRKLAYQLFEAVGAPKEEWPGMFSAAIDRAITKLQSKPGILDIIKDEATRREDNLPITHHYSKNRVANIVNRVRSLGEEPTNAPGSAEGSSAGGEEAVSRTEGESPRTPQAQKLKPFSPPKKSYDILLEGHGGEDRTVTIEALDRKKAFELVQKKYPGANMYRMTAERTPEVGPPVQMAPRYPKNPEGFEHIDPKVLEHLEPDEMDAIKGNKRSQETIEKSFKGIKPGLKETMASIQAGSALRGWWQRFIDTFDALGKPTEAAKIEKLGPEHAEALKAWHSAVSGNKAVEHANRVAWGTYADWLDAGRPKDRATINKIVADNGKPKGNAAISDTLNKKGKVINQGLDTTKLYNLINSPQMRDISPTEFHGKIFDPENPSPVAGVSPGARKIPSMAATVAGKGNLNRLVLDAHMLDFYGENGWTDNTYIAHSAHLRMVAKELGMTAGEAQEQIWGTVLGIKKLLREGVPASKIPKELTHDVVNSIGKDYADIIRDDPELNSIFEQIKKHGIDPGGERAQQRLREITGNKPAAEQAGAHKNLLTNVAKRIQGQFKKPAVTQGGAAPTTQAGKKLAAK